MLVLVQSFVLRHEYRSHFGSSEAFLLVPLREHYQSRSTSPLGSPLFVQVLTPFPSSCRLSTLTQVIENLGEAQENMPSAREAVVTLYGRDAADVIYNVIASQGKIRDRLKPLRNFVACDISFPMLLGVELEMRRAKRVLTRALGANLAIGPEASKARCTPVGRGVARPHDRDQFNFPYLADCHLVLSQHLLPSLNGPAVAGAPKLSDVMAGSLGGERYESLDRYMIHVGNSGNMELQSEGTPPWGGPRLTSWAYPPNYMVAHPHYPRVPFAQPYRALHFPGGTRAQQILGNPSSAWAYMVLPSALSVRWSTRLPQRLRA